MEYIKNLCSNATEYVNLPTEQSILLVVLLAGLYWIYFVPWNWTKDLTEVSYNFLLTTNLRRNEAKKRDIINRLRRLRQSGEATSMPSPFPNGWFAIAESSSVKRGQAISVACLGEQFAIFRTKQGNVYVLNAYCPHMGANMGIGGKVVGDSLQCPFHSWSFKGSDGVCDNIPYSTCAIPQSAKVKKWTSAEVNEFIFVWYHAEGDSPWPLPSVDLIDSGAFLYHGRNEYLITCHMQDIPENGADLAHFEAIHKNSFLAGGDAEGSLLAGCGSHQWRAEWKPSASEKHLASVLLSHSIIIRNLRLCTIHVRAEQIGPSYVQLHLDTMFGKVLILQTTIPVEPLMQKVIHRFYAPRWVAPFMKFLIMGESVMFERDVNVWNHKTFTHNPCLVREDRAIRNFRNWFAQFYSKNSKSFALAKDTLEW